MIYAKLRDCEKIFSTGHGISLVEVKPYHVALPFLSYFIVIIIAMPSLPFSLMKICLTAPGLMVERPAGIVSHFTKSAAGRRRFAGRRGVGRGGRGSDSVEHGDVPRRKERA